jgi:hypothetical protein
MQKIVICFVFLFFLSVYCKGQTDYLSDCGGDSLFITPEKIASPIVGFDSLNCWINENNKYREIKNNSKKKNIVIVGFNIDTIGIVNEIRILRSIGEPYDSEAIRLLEECPIEWEPSICQGKKWTTPCTYPISFRKRRH